MATRRRYTKREKLSAVMAADMVGVVAAEEQTGIPESTIRYWLDKPEFAEFRAKAREDMAEEVKVVGHLAWKRVGEALVSGDMEPRDALFAAEKATTLMLLLTGEATSRSEHTELPAPFDDEEKRALREAINGALDAQKAEP
jgi:hypothetical protein